MRAYAVTAGRSHCQEVPSGTRLEAHTARLAIACYPEAGLLVLQSRPPHSTDGIVLDRPSQRSGRETASSG